MDIKDAKRQLANRKSNYKAKSRRKIGLNQIKASGDSHRSPKTNYKEDSIIDAIDMRNVLMKYSDYVDKLKTGKIDVQSFLGSVAPHVAIEMLKLALEGESEKVRLTAGQDLMDRAGYTKVQKFVGAVVDPRASEAQLISMIEGINRKTKTIEIEEDDQDQEE